MGDFSEAKEWETSYHNMRRDRDSLLVIIGNLKRQLESRDTSAKGPYEIVHKTLWNQIREAKQEAEAKLKEAQRVLDVLRWIPLDQFPHKDPKSPFQKCICCHAQRAVGCYPDCRLAALLPKEEEKEKPAPSCEEVLGDLVRFETVNDLDDNQVFIVPKGWKEKARAALDAVRKEPRDG